MRFVTVRDLRTTPAKIWKSLPEEQELILTNNGKPIALITPLGESDLEETISAVRKARAQAAMQQMQLSSVNSSTYDMSMEEIDAEIASYRKERHK
ncbi:MAG: type II toxin-antitoxin system Phd/YefM family antitoxin [Spirochaetales bacterium]|nr:type II toxin-antitoxin system Phd/YefM family antitoxin [Spirochaetales bacterium]